jgi:HEPN domain-containing protein
MRQSRHDLADAEFAAAHDRHALACFLSHQAGEKAVAAFLFARGAEYVWGHALADLCQDAIALEPSFDLIATVAVLLDKYHTATRYPTGLPGGIPAEAYDAHDSARAIAIARDVRDFVLKHVDLEDPGPG